MTTRPTVVVRPLATVSGDGAFIDLKLEVSNGRSIKFSIDSASLRDMIDDLIMIAMAAGKRRPAAAGPGPAPLQDISDLLALYLLLRLRAMDLSRPYSKQDVRLLAMELATIATGMDRPAQPDAPPAE